MKNKLQTLGYISTKQGGRPDRNNPDFLHTNSIDYNPELDQIVLSVLGYNEIWIIDHSTTTEEAAGSEGGCRGRGGDLLYRWGNPAVYNSGTIRDQTLFAQHDARWIPPGLPGAGNILIFNNGRGRPDGDYSSVVEIAPPLDKNGTYKKKKNTAFFPRSPDWEYTTLEKSDFFSSHISGAQRLPNGNTLICSGEKGRFFEVKPVSYTHLTLPTN